MWRGIAQYDVLMELEAKKLQGSEAPSCFLQ